MTNEADSTGARLGLQNLQITPMFMNTIKGTELLIFYKKIIERAMRGVVPVSILDVLFYVIINPL